MKLFRKLWYILSIFLLLGIITASIVFLSDNQTNRLVKASETVNENVVFTLPIPEDRNLYQIENGLRFSQLPESPTIIVQENKTIAMLSYIQIADSSTTEIDRKFLPYLNSDDYVVFSLTGSKFISPDPCNYAVATKYTYDNAIKPILDALTDYVEQSHRDVTYQIDVLYSYQTANKTYTTDSQIPVAFEIQAFSADSGNSVNFHIIIFNSTANKKI